MPSDLNVMDHVAKSFLATAMVGAMLAVSSTGAAFADPGQLAARVQWHQGRLSIDADGVPLKDLLAAIASTTSVEMRGLAHLESAVSLHISNVTLRGGLDAALARTNYALVEQPSARDRETHMVVIVIGHKSDSGDKASGSAKVVAQDEPSAAADPYQAVERFAVNGNMRALRDAVASADPTIRALAMQRLGREDPVEGRRAAIAAAKSEEPMQRVFAAHVLGGLDSPESTETLGAALADPDSGVRQAAVVGLLGQTSPAAFQFLLHALQDDDESIRRLGRELLNRSDRGS